VDTFWTQSLSRERDRNAVIIEPADDTTTTDPELRNLVEGLVPIVTSYISNQWDWWP